MGSLRRGAAPAIALLMVVSACGGGESEDTTAPGSDESTSSSIAGDAAADATAATGDGTEPGEAGTPDDAGEDGTQPARSSGGEPPATSADAPTPPGLKPFVGSYRHHALGSATINGSAQPVDMETTTLIEDISPTDQRVTASGGQQGSTVQVMRFSADKVELVSLEMKGALNKRFEPSPPALFAPVPAVVGRSWSWDATSTDKVTHIHQASRIDRTEQVSVGGQTVDVFVVETDLTITGDIKATGHITSWVSPAYKVPVRTHSTLKGSYATFTFASDVTSDLLSLRPS
jgi:hypothetical protein